jgi:Tfp pilus assembly protein PilX
MKRTRADERGAALFIVMMVIVLLSAIGVYAVRAAALLEMASGNDRKAAQAMYISEFGLRLVAADMIGKEDDYKARVTSGQSTCRASANLVLPDGHPIPCFSVDQIEATSRMTAGTGAYVGRFDLTNATLDGLLGRIVRRTESANAAAGFRVEITDIGPAPRAKAGTDLSSQNFKHQQVTFTTTGLVRPSGMACDDTVQAASVQGIRSHVTFMSSN